MRSRSLDIGQVVVFFFSVFCLTVKVEVNKNAKKEKTNAANIKPRPPNKLYSQSTIFCMVKGLPSCGTDKSGKKPSGQDGPVLTAQVTNTGFAF